jgi:hypothetical protein
VVLACYLGQQQESILRERQDIIQALCDKVIVQSERRAKLMLGAVYNKVSTITDITNGGVRCFSYDLLDRLTGTSEVHGASYTYRPIGNLEAKAEASTLYTMLYSDPDHMHAPKAPWPGCYYVCCLFA